MSFIKRDCRKYDEKRKAVSTYFNGMVHRKFTHFIWVEF